jgi:hypothetical protein
MHGPVHHKDLVRADCMGAGPKVRRGILSPEIKDHADVIDPTSGGGFARACDDERNPSDLPAHWPSLL